jgi:hypothetical protein
MTGEAAKDAFDGIEKSNAGNALESVVGKLEAHDELPQILQFISSDSRG